MADLPVAELREGEPLALLRLVQFSSVQFSSVCSWAFGLGLIGYYFLSSIIIFKVQFNSVQRRLFIIQPHLSGSIYAVVFDIPFMATFDTRGYEMVW